MQSMTPYILTASLFVATAPLLWWVLPEEKKYAVRLWTGLAKIDLDLVLVSWDRKEGYHLIIKHDGLELPSFGFILETMEWSRRWSVSFDPRLKLIVGTRHKQTPTPPRYRRHIFKLEKLHDFSRRNEQRFLIGQVIIDTSWSGELREKEYLDYIISCESVTIKRGKLEIPFHRAA
jgi:hypothetical protein